MMTNTQNFLTNRFMMTLKFEFFSFPKTGCCYNLSFAPKIIEYKAKLKWPLAMAISDVDHIKDYWITAVGTNALKEHAILSVILVPYLFLS